MAEFKDKLSAKLHKAMKDNVVVQNAIKSAFASYDRQNFSNVSVVPAVDTVTDTPAQQISVQNDGLSRRLQFLQYAESHLPRIPQELLDLPIPEDDLPKDDLFIPVVEVSDKSVVCKCHHNLTCKLHFYGEESLYVDADKISKPSQSQEMSPLKVLFGFMDDLPVPEDDLFIPKDDVHSKPIICDMCKDVFLRTVYCWLRVRELNDFKCFHDSPIFGETIVLHQHSIRFDDIARQQLDSLRILFDFIEKNYFDFDSVDF